MRRAEEITIRHASVNDAVKIAEIHVHSWQTTYRGIVPDSYLQKLDVGQKTEFWKATLEKPDAVYKSEIWIACIDGQPVGFATWGKNRDTTTPYQAELYAIYVLAEHQKRGVGTALYQQLTQFLRNNAYKSFCVWSLDSNRNAHKAYEAWGLHIAPAFRKEILLDEIWLEEILHIGEVIP